MRTVALSFFVLSVLVLDGAARADAAAESRYRRFYLGFNPIAAAASVEYDSGYVDMLIPVVSNLEFGAALAAGVFASADHALELRFSAGPAVQRTVLQSQLVWNWFVFGRLTDSTFSGVYVGAQARYWEYRSKARDERFMHFVPAAQVGYWWSLGNVALDVRLSQPVAIVSGSSAPHTHAAAAFRFSPVSRTIPVLPMLGTTVSYAF